MDAREHPRKIVFGNVNILQAAASTAAPLPTREFAATSRDVKASLNVAGLCAFVSVS